MKVLVTGVPGWLGNRLLQRLAKDKIYQVRCLTLPSMAEQLKAFNCEVVTGDIRDKAAVEKACAGVDIVLHLCGLIHPKKIKELFEINTQGTENILSGAIKAGAKRIVYISSNAPAGVRRDERLMRENDPPQPYLAYGKSKYLAEQMLLKANADKKIETVILRPCWFYGPGQPPRQTRFFKMIQEGKPIVFGNGRNLRSLSYVDNTVEAILLAATSPKAAGQVYWIADERAYPTVEIYETVAKLLNVKDFKPKYVPDLVSECCALADRVFQVFGLYQQEIHVAGEMNKSIACSIDKAKKELGYDPRIGLEEGMKISIDWCRKEGQL